MRILVPVVLEVHGTVEVTGPTVVDGAPLPRHDLHAAEDTRRARAVGLVMDEAEREQVHAAAGWTAG